MTELMMPLVFEVLTSAVLMEHTQFGQVSFCVADGHCYAFLLNRRALQRLGLQIERALKQAPASRRKRKACVR